MTEYTFKEYRATEIDALARDWRRLERGNDMTYFQSFAWNRMLMPLTPEREGRCGVRLIAQIWGGKSCLSPHCG